VLEKGHVALILIFTHNSECKSNESLNVMDVKPCGKGKILWAHKIFLS
jgi:hypothetical protein